MKDKDLIRSITLGGIFSTIYLILTLLSIYVVPILSIFGLMIMPIFAAYYASIFKFKSIIVFNISTLILCFIAGISDPFFCLLYILPTLIIGDAFGFFNKLKLKLYSTIFLQSITYSITNLLALYLGEIFYDTQIISFIISDPWLYNNLSLVILFILSSAEAIFSSLFISEQLKKLKIVKEKEKGVPIHAYIAFILCFISIIVTYFISNNFYFLFVFLSIVLAFPQFIKIYKKLKYPSAISIPYILICASLSFYLCYKQLFYLIPIFLLLPFLIYSVVKITFYIYNIKRSKEDVENG